MADATKHVPINGGTLISDLKSLFSIFRTKTTRAFAYGFMFAFVVFTVFLAFNPSSNSSSPWFTNIFTSSTSLASSSTNTSSSSYGSQFSSNFTNFFPNSTKQGHNVTSLPPPTNTSRSQDTTLQSPNLLTEPSIPKNQTRDKVEVLKQNQSTIVAPKAPVTANHTVDSLPKSDQNPIAAPKAPVTANQTGNSPPKSDQNPIAAPKAPVTANQTGNSPPNIAQNVDSNHTSSLTKKPNSGATVKQRSDNLVDSLMNCDIFDGDWVKDNSYPLYKPGSCSLIDEQFNCFLNGRPDNGYHKLKWKPRDCSLPRLDGGHMLELLRGKRLVFVGDSLNRNMWESLVCILRNSVKNRKNVYEVSGRHHFRTEASYSFVFKDYNCTVEFFVSPFLVQEWEMPDKKGLKKETLRLDLIGMSADNYKNADIIIFNTGHWWTHEKTSLGKDYYQEGSNVYHELNVLEAFRKALTTWGRWVDANINPKKTLVFFRGYSASHFSGGQWNSGGQCDNEIEPIKNKTYLMQYPPKMSVLESVLKGMKIHVSYLNITRLTDYRKDGHPSIYRKQNPSKEEKIKPLQFQDCSHWCLPGVPDAWNELLYAELLINQNQKQQEKKRP
ncbi:protein trichome birefringence [Cornus florida]|uniref:protein trichome birefringence n=1 Tax=Cornus florida TaxID=4283 RepID=UPI00289B9655|nr:protein trichome birefringence [Cornus florida]